MRSRMLASALLGAILILVAELATFSESTVSDEASESLTVPIGEGEAKPLHRVALFDQKSGIFYIAHDGETTNVTIGVSGDPLAGDFDCDGTDGLAVFDSTTGSFFVDNDLDGEIDTEGRFPGGDRMLIGDFVGDDLCDEVAVYDTRRGYMRIGHSAGPGFVTETRGYYFGVPGDEPFVGDFNNDLQTDLGLHRDTTGLVYMRTSHDTGFANTAFVYGNPEDRVLAGDWTGDGTETVGVYRPGEGTIYLRHSNTFGVADETIAEYGNRSLVPVAGSFGQLSGGGDPPPPYFDATDSCFDPEGVFAPTGRLLPVPARPSTVPGTVTYSVAVEEGIGFDPSCFSIVVASILADERGWQRDQEIQFEQVASGADFRIALASPRTVDRRCAPLRTNGVYSCFNGTHTMINTSRWLNGSKTVPTLSQYRQMVINHEVGHAIGHGHVGCRVAGEPAPVMMQQTINLGGCRANPWPLESELTGLHR
ncbi:MAG: DUF3152 domain-containing protein [Acidimicrobiia bacterium]|nr:DUF3152 domain-containing protein [Acidimicrobiia bacterium]NNL28141.1 DUF3152 domain-containing protein [Acidimicrobiia bacterium]